MGGTAEDEEDEREGVADSVTVRRRGRGRKKGTPTDLRSSCKDSAEHTTTEHHSQVYSGGGEESDRKMVQLAVLLWRLPVTCSNWHSKPHSQPSPMLCNRGLSNNLEAMD